MNSSEPITIMAKNICARFLDVEPQIYMKKGKRKTVYVWETKNNNINIGYTRIEKERETEMQELKRKVLPERVGGIKWGREGRVENSEI